MRGQPGIIHDRTPHWQPMFWAWMHRWAHNWTCIDSQATWVIYAFGLPLWHVIVCLTQVWQSLFPFFVTKRSSLLSKLGKHLRSSTTCLYWHTFCLNSAKCWFYSLDPIVKLGHCQRYDLACLYCLQQTNARDRNVDNVHILQQELMSKINILRCWDKK